MGCLPGTINNPKGRTVGSLNKDLKPARQAIATFVDGNIDRLVGWLDRIAEDNPKEAFNCFMSVVDFHIPRLARSDNTETKVNINLNLFARQSALKDLLIEDAQKTETIENGSI